MSVLTDLIYGGSNAVAGLTEGAVNDAIAKYGAEKEIAFPDTAYAFPTIYAATGVKVKTLGDLPACVGVLKSLITGQEDLGQALNAGLATAVGAEIIEGLKYLEADPYANESGIGFVPDPIIRSLGVPLVTGDIPGVAVVLGKADNEAGIKVYNRQNGKPIVNSADAGSRIGYIDLAAANDAICIALCSADGIAKDNEERMMHCDNMLERGLQLGMEATDLWFDPLFLVVKGMQDKQMEVLEAIRMFSEKGLKSTGGLSNNSNGAPKEVRPIMDSALVAMCMMQGLTSAIVNPNDRRLMETIKSCDIFKNHVLYSDSYLDL